MYWIAQNWEFIQTVFIGLGSIIAAQFGPKR